MTISTTDNRVSYAGNGSTTAFSFPNKFLADADLVVLLVNDTTEVSTTQTLTTHYTVSGAGDAAGGTVTMVTAPASGETLVIYRDPAVTQVVDLVEGDSLPVETSVEQPLDKLTMLVQRVKDLIDRAISLPDSESDTDTDNASWVLPTKTARTSRYFGFDENGYPAALASPTDTALTTTFIETLLDDTTQAAAKTTLGLGTGDTPQFTGVNFESSDAGITGPVMESWHNSPSPAVSDNVWTFTLYGEDDADAKEAYAEIVATIVDPTAGATQGRLVFKVADSDSGVLENIIGLDYNTVTLFESGVPSNRNSTLRIYGGTAGTSQLHFADTDSNIGRLEYDHASNDLDIYTNDTLQATLSSAGHLQLITGGLEVGGTGAANRLDDYEEGTWTPVLSDGTNNATMGANNFGTYTKIGDRVYFTAEVHVSTIDSVSGNIRITGLPFTVNTTKLGGVSFVDGSSLALPSAGDVPAGTCVPNTTYINVRRWTSTSGASLMQATEWTDGGDCAIHGSYTV